VIVCAAGPAAPATGGGTIESAGFAQQSAQDYEYQVLYAGPGPEAGPAAVTVMERLADRGLGVVMAGTAEGLRSTIAVHGRAGAGRGGGAGAPGPARPGRQGMGPGSTGSGGAGGGTPDGAGASAPGAGAPGPGATPPTSAVPIGAAVLSWELFSSGAELAAVLDDIQRLSSPPPVVVISERAQDQPIPADLAARTAGSFWLRADSPHFVADQVEWLVRTFALRSQVLGALAASAGSPAGPGGAGRPGAELP
jgi:Orn/Lys/Arg decarboxylase, N-terminal domain